MKVVGILQARMGSSRLPGKVLINIVGKPMLQLQLERLMRSSQIDKLVVATTVNNLDKPIVDLCTSLKISCFRGSEEDLLDRYYQTARKHKADYIVRLTGDDPLTDPILIDEMIKKIKKDRFDAITNSIQPTYPEGLDVTVLSFEALARAWTEANLQSQREHVTPYIFDNENIFKIFHQKQIQDFSHLRWTVDYEEDITFIRKIYEAFYKVNKSFSSLDVYKLIEANPSLLSINSHFLRNAGLIESIIEDKEVYFDD